MKLYDIKILGLDLTKLYELQKKIEAMKYPGYPYSTAAVLINGTYAVEDGIVMSAVDYVKNLAEVAAYKCIDCTGAVRGRWAGPEGALPRAEEILEKNDDEFTLDSINTAKLYLIVNSLILEQHYEKTHQVAFIWYDGDSDSFIMQRFHNQAEINWFVQANDIDM